MKKMLRMIGLGLTGAFLVLAGSLTILLVATWIFTVILRLTG